MVDRTTRREYQEQRGRTLFKTAASRIARVKKDRRAEAFHQECAGLVALLVLALM